MEKIIQNAGKEQLGNFSKEFAYFNDDVLFGQNWNNKDIDLKTRCIITVVSLISSGITDSSLKYHLNNAKNYGVSKKEIAAIITHISFYVGFPKAWAAFNLAKEIWTEEINENMTEKEKHQSCCMFDIGEKNDAFSKYFIGQSYISPISTNQVNMYNVTFEPGCRNNWHIHRASKDGGQILICVAGRGYCQKWGEEPIEMKAGDCVNIPSNVKHWHGAAKDSWFSHIAIEVPGENTSNEWLEPVEDEYYNKLK